MMVNYFDISAGTEKNKVSFEKVLNVVIPVCGYTAKCATIVCFVLVTNSLGACAVESVSNLKAAVKAAKSAKSVSKTAKALAQATTVLGSCKVGQDGAFYVLEQQAAKNAVSRAVMITAFVFVLLCGFQAVKLLYEEV